MTMVKEFTITGLIAIFIIFTTTTIVYQCEKKSTQPIHYANQITIDDTLTYPLIKFDFPKIYSNPTPTKSRKEGKQKMERADFLLA